MNEFASPAAPLSDLAVIDIEGADAAIFLHGQLTNDVTGIGPGQARLAGYCTAKGRLLGTMVVWRSSTETEPLRLHALLKADIAEAVSKRLSMFVLRAKVKLALSKRQVFGVMTPASVADGNDQPGRLSLLPPAVEGEVQPWTVAHTDEGTWISAPSADPGVARWWLITTSSIEADATAPTGSAWRAADMAAGLPWVQAATQDLFIPQTLNMDLIDGVSFSKGCYPGQEVVARSHYRGTVKRRMAYGQVSPETPSDASDLAGVDTYDAGKPDNPCGRIIDAARGGDGSLHVLMEVQLADLDSADFRLGVATGPVIRVQSMPYSIKSDA